MKNLNKDITAFIMAGGQSTRFGGDKLLHKYKGVRLIERVADVLHGIFTGIIIIADDRDKFSFLDMPVVPDIIRKAGPIGGIYTAVNHSATHKIFCAAADMPDLNADFIRYMISVSDTHDIVVPEFKGMYEALHAIYTKDCLKHIDKCISSGNFKITAFYSDCDVRIVDENEINRFGTPDKLFKNVNYLKDIE